jgi:hypothetical protein
MRSPILVPLPQAVPANDTPTDAPRRLEIEREKIVAHGGGGFVYRIIDPIRTTASDVEVDDELF